MIHVFVSLSRMVVLEETSVTCVSLALPLALRCGGSGPILLGLSFIIFDKEGNGLNQWIPNVEDIHTFLGPVPDLLTESQSLGPGNLHFLKLPRCFGCSSGWWPLHQVIFKTTLALMDQEATSVLFIRLPFGTVEHGLLLITANIRFQLIALFRPNAMIYSLVESRLKITKHLPTKC